LTCELDIRPLPPVQCKVKIGVPELSVQTHPDREHHFRPPCRGNIPQVYHHVFFPSKTGQNVTHELLGICIIATHEYHMVPWQECRIDHDRIAHGVQTFHHP